MPSGTTESLLDHLRRVGGHPLPREVAELPEDASVVGYFNHLSQVRNVPAALCYEVASMAHPDARSLEQLFKPRPAERLELAEQWRHDLMATMSHDGLTIETAEDSLTIPRRTFHVPDLRFGNETVLSTNRKRSDAIVVANRDWGTKRMELLRHPAVGFFDKKPLGRQYLIVPDSMMDSYGSEFVGLIEETTQAMFPQDTPFKPEVVQYNDRVQKTSVEQGLRIVDAAKANCFAPGHALIIVHRTDSTSRPGEDQLSASVVRELEKVDIVAAVSHTDVPRRCFRQGNDGEGNVKYFVPQRNRVLLHGYARGLVLNKILLNNERWPFAMDERLHADITIGIDVKNNTAGFLLVGPNAEVIRPICSPSRRHEKLSRDQIAHEVCNLVAAEASHIAPAIENIVIHRDGRLFDEERLGIVDAIERLRAEGAVDMTAKATVLEIHKTSRLPIRLFSVDNVGDARKTLNPRHGDHVIFGDTGFVCTTGFPFKQFGTVRPLQVQKVAGPLPMQQCLEDLFRLSCLAFTKPDDCSRVPLTLRLLDRRLRDEASEYDEDAFRFKSGAGKRVTA